jgi:hypothetical protein
MAGEMTALEVRDAMGATVLHAMRAGPSGWHFTGPELSAVLIADRPGVVRALADAIGRCLREHGACSVNGHPAAGGVPVFLYIDGLGGAWHDGHYWPPHEYLLELTEDEVATDGEP